MTSDERLSLITCYRQGHAELMKALEGLLEVELDGQPDNDEWTIRQIIHHLADSELIAAIRLRRLLAEEAPVIEGFDQLAYARALRYQRRAIEEALRTIEAVQATTADLLCGLTDEEWHRAGVHTERGPYSVERWLELNATHTHEHATQIRKNRRAWARHRQSGLSAG